jgi:hypothetical protein
LFSAAQTILKGQIENPIIFTLSPNLDLAFWRQEEVLTGIWTENTWGFYPQVYPPSPALWPCPPLFKGWTAPPVTQNFKKIQADLVLFEQHRSRINLQFLKPTGLTKIFSQVRIMAKSLPRPISG